MRLMHDNTQRISRKIRGRNALGLLALPLLSLALLAGCGGGGGGNGNSGTGTTTTGTTTTGTTTTGTNSGTQNPLSVTAATVSGLTATAMESSNTVAVGGTVTYTLTLTNTTANPIPVHTTSLPPALPSVPAAAVTIRNAGGTITFQPLPGAPPIYTANLAAGASLTTTITANGFTTAGVYSATAVFGDDVALNGTATLPTLTVTAQ